MFKYCTIYYFTMLITFFPGGLNSIDFIFNDYLWTDMGHSPSWTRSFPVQWGF